MTNKIYQMFEDVVIARCGMFPLDNGKLQRAIILAGLWLLGRTEDDFRKRLAQLFLPEEDWEQLFLPESDWLGI